MLSSTDRLLRCITTLQYGLTHRTLQTWIETLKRYAGHGI